MIFKHNNLSIYYKKYGNKNKNILILPGWGDTRCTFKYMIDYFQNDYSIYIIDYPGFGKSPIPTTELQMIDYAELIKNFIEIINIKNPIIIAHSFGGRIAAYLLANYHINTKKLILIDVAGIRRKSMKRIFKEKSYKLLKLIIKLLPNKYRSVWMKRLLQLFGSSDYQSLPNTMKKTFQNIVSEDLRKKYAIIKLETLIIWGEKDKDTPLKDGYYLQKKIKDAALIIYPKATHYSYLQYPILTNSIIKEFVK